MSIITIHRVNTIDGLRETHPRYGVEVDIRHDPQSGKLFLNHELDRGDDFEEYVKIAASKNCPLIILNIKESGIETKVIEIVTRYNITNWFLLDVEFPFIFKAMRGDIENIGGRIAIRYSESEPIEQALALAGHFSWVWVDVNTLFPLNKESYRKLRDAGYKLALVCPERWGRPKDIPKYIKYMKKNNIMVDTVMTSAKHAGKWEKSGILL